MSCTDFIDRLYSSEKLVRHMCYSIAKIIRRGGRLISDPMPVRLIFMKLLKRV